MGGNKDRVAEVSFAENGASPSLAVVRAVAEGEGVDPLDLPPLYESMNAPELDALFEGDSPVQFEFEYEGYEVTILENDRVVVRK